MIKINYFSKNHGAEFNDQPSRLYTETSLSLRDVLPINPKHYDKNRAPKYHGQPTIVYFHVTVLSIDSINEESMVIILLLFITFILFIYFLIYL